jgi:hypothetical protein
LSPPRTYPSEKGVIRHPSKRLQRHFMATEQYCSFMEGKMQGKDSVRSLPAPMDYPSLSSALLELGVGMRKAVETCLECWKV